MYDMHYDLLTILYYNFKQNNKYANIPKLIDDCQKIYTNNIKGGIINLYFMSEAEMYNEIGITKDELLDVKKMFKKSIKYLEYLKEINVIPKNIDFLYSIEGCDYLNNEHDLEELYKIGLRSILPVWNNENKFASGNRSNKGLTELGIKLIEKALSLGIIIDVSHANEKSFHDILNRIKKHNNYTLIASHSNVKSICNRSRNLNDEELIRLRDLNGYISLFTNSNFLSKNNKTMSYQDRQRIYLKHLDYLINKLQYPKDKILVSTDDMNFHPDIIYHGVETFPIENISNELYSLISNNYDEQLANMIIYDNPKKIIDKVKNNKCLKKNKEVIK